jgi:hypothetical protein
MKEYGMENVPLHLHEPQAKPKMYPVGGKAKTCARLSFSVFDPLRKWSALRASALNFRIVP